MTIYVNGRFLTQPVSGVQRYAREILGALDKALRQSSDLRERLGSVVVLVPERVKAPDWQILQLRHVPGKGGHLWEQGALYRASKDGVLISLGNSGPSMQRAHVLCLHDANLWEIPEAYSLRYRLWHRFLRPRLARRAAALLTVSRHSAANLARRLGIDEERFRIVPNSADHMLRLPPAPDAPARYGLTPGGYLLSVGNRSPNKNLRALIAAHASCNGEVPPLALVGSNVPGVVADEIGEIARVKVLGRVADCDLKGLYEGAAGFVFPALHEGFGIPPLEAMRLGVPVICARSGAMPEVLGNAPLWFDPRDVEDIARAMRGFAKAENWQRADMVSRGRLRANGYGWHKSALRLTHVVAEVREGLRQFEPDRTLSHRSLKKEDFPFSGRT